MSGPSRERLLLFLSFFFLYAATTSGDLIADSELRWRVAERIVDTGWVAMDSNESGMCAEGLQGKLYTVWHPGQSVCLVPFVLAGRLLADLPFGLHGTPSMYGQFLAGLLFFPACGGLCLVLVHLITQDVTGDRHAARWIAVAVGAGTMHWHHSVSTGDETQVALCLLTCLFAVQRVCRTGHRGYLILAFVSAGVGLWFRLPSILVSGSILLMGFLARVADTRALGSGLRTAAAWWVAFCIGFVPFVAALAAYNFARYGCVWETGYGQSLREGLGVEIFATPLSFGLPAILFSPGKGVFVFNPLLLLVIPGVIALWRTNRWLAATIGLTFLSTVLFHSCYTVWSGDLTWGPRFLASAMGIWLLGLIPLLRQPRRKYLLSTLLAVSVVIQLSSVVYNYGLEFAQDRRHGLIPDEYVWRPAESQLVCRLRNMLCHALGCPNHQSIPPAVERPELLQVRMPPEAVSRMHAVHFFPFKARANLGDQRLFRILLAVWLGLLAALVATIWRWRRLLRLEKTPDSRIAMKHRARSDERGSRPGNRVHAGVGYTDP